MGEEPIFLTRAAEGLDRRGFTFADVEKMTAAGVIDPDEKFELIDGEIVPRNAQAMPHLLMKGRLGWALKAASPADVDLVQDATVVLGQRTFFDADVLAFLGEQGEPLHRAGGRAAGCGSLRQQPNAGSLHQGSTLWGRAGVPELWVVELNEMQTYVFRSPGTAAWGEPTIVGFEESLSPLFLPDARIRLSELL